MTGPIRKKRIISILHVVLFLFLIFGALSFLLYSGYHAYSLITKKEQLRLPVGDIPVVIKNKPGTEGHTPQGEAVFIKHGNISISMLGAERHQVVINYSYYAVRFLLAWFILFSLWKIFGVLKQSVKENNPFPKKNASRIRYIAYSMMAFSLVELFYPALIKSFGLKEILYKEEIWKVTWDYSSLEYLLWGLVILVIAEVYRLGTEMKEEQDLTV